MEGDGGVGVRGRMLCIAPLKERLGEEEGEEEEAAWSLPVNPPPTSSH